jgi:adenylate cyclase
VDSFDGPLGRNIIDTHIWAVHQGLRGARAYELFDGYCQRLVIHSVPLWRVQAGMQTLHPHWGAYSYLWRRDLNAIQPEQHARSDLGNPQWLRSPMYDLIRRANAGENNPSMRRRLDAGPQQRDFLVLDEFFQQGATDYFAQLFTFGESGDPSQGTGAIYSFTTDRGGGFHDDDMALLQSTLPALSLAMKAHTSHEIASALLGTYLGKETGRRVHAGAIERGSVETIHAVLWFADIRGFTAMSDDASPSDVVIDLLNNVFEGLAAALRARRRSAEVSRRRHAGHAGLRRKGSRHDLPGRA